MRLDDDLRNDFERRLRPHGPVLLRFLRRMLRRPSTAPDVLQTVLMKALQTHRRYDPETSFKAWIYRFAAHEAQNENRRGGRERSMPEEEGVEQADLELEMAYEEVLADPAATLDRLGDPLARAVADLPGRERTAFLLRSLVSLECRDIATLLGVPEGTVMSWLFRARKRLRLRLASYARSVRWKAEAR